MDGSMDGSPKPNVCKFSSENWKILENLREEKRKLEEFDASALANSPDISAENEIKDESRIELHKELEAEEMNNSIVLDKKHEIKIEKYCRPSICDLKTYFTEEPANERLSNDDVVDLKESCVHSHDVNVDGVEDEKSISSRFDHNGMFSNVPEALRPFILCILSIPSFRQYIKEISKDISNIVNTEKDFPTISLFIDYFWKMSTFNLKYDSKCPENVFDTESLSLMMITVFEILHEELVQAKQKNIIKAICMADCRLVQKGNHTVVSHLFRGHYKKKIYCECEHVEVTKDFFTMINVSQDDIHYKSLSYATGVMMMFLQTFVNTLSRNGNGLVVRRYLYTVNNYSTVESLKEKFCSICKTSDTTNEMTISSLMMALIVQHRIEKIIASETLIFDVMCEDGQIWLFNIHAGNIMLDYIENSKNVLLRSKETTPITTPRSSLLLGAIEIESIASNCKKSDYALVMVLLTWIDEIGDLGLPFLLQVPRVSNGLHIYERLARVIKFNHSDFQKVIISAKNKMNHCLICLNSCCEGCPVQMSDKVVLSDNYMVHVKFAMSSRDEMIETFDDDSMLLNEPINMLTIDECITQHLQRIDTQVCKSCMKNLPKHVKVEILKKPHVLCIHMPKSNKSKYSPTILAKERIDYLLGRSLKSRTYLLHVLKQYNKESPCLQKDAFESFPYPEAFEMFDSQSNEKTSTLFYLRNEGCKYERNKRLFRKFGGQEKQHNYCKTKFSPRSGQLTDRLGKKLYDTCEEFDCSSYGQYTPRSFSSMSQRTTCTCHRCQALGQFHAKIVSGKSTSLSQSTKPQLCSEIRTMSPSSIQSVFMKENTLYKAIRNQDLKTLVKCLDSGADINQMVKGMAALHLVAGMEEPFGSIFTKLCLQYGGDPNLPSSNDGMTPVHTAVLINNPDILSLLLQSGGIPHIKDNQGRSAFDILLQSGNKNSEYILRLLRSETNDKTCNGDNDEDIVHNKRLSNINISDDVVEDIVEDADKMIGETTFDQVFSEPGNHSNSSTIDGIFECGTNDLNESAVSQHFTEIDDSVPTFNGSTLPTWLSWFSCTRSRYKPRRHDNDQRHTTVILRERLGRWWNNMKQIFQ